MAYARVGGRASTGGRRRLPPRPLPPMGNTGLVLEPAITEFRCGYKGRRYRSRSPRNVHPSTLSRVLATLFADYSKLEAALDLPSGFLESLSTEDDWSFVVKAHALLEAALTTVLVAHSDPRLTDTFRKLQMGGRTGKVSVAQALELLDQPCVQFLTQFSELRNRLLHDVRHVTFPFHDHVSRMTQHELRSHARTIGGVFEVPEKAIEEAEAAEMLQAYPKEAFVFGVSAILGRVLFQLHPEERESAAKRGLPLLVIIGVVGIFEAVRAKRGSADGSPASPGPVH